LVLATLAGLLPILEQRAAAVLPIHISVYEQVVCYTNICEPFSSNLATDQKSAAGVRGATACPAFCYRVTVTNDGPVTLTNVTVIDPALNLSGCGFPTTFLPGQAASCIVTVARCEDTNNTVTVTGQSDGVTATSSDQTYTTIIPAGVSCTKYYTLDGGPPTNNAVIGQNPHTVVWYITVTNTGLANLQDVHVQDIGPSCAASYVIAALPTGASITFALCTNAALVCTDGVTNTVTATANSFTLGANQTPICNVTTNGNNIGVTSECTAVIFCCDAPPTITCPGNITTNAAPNQSSQIVTFAPTVTDSCGLSTTSGCTPPSGSSFPTGATTVTCSAINAAGNTASCSFTVTVTESADLLISKSANRGTVKPGQTISYTITVNNLGPSTAKNVIINDPTPQGTVFLNATNKSGHVITAPGVGSTGTVTWYLGNLGAQETSFNGLIVTVLVRGNANIVNTATVTSDTPDPNLANNTATVTTRRTGK